VLCTTVVHNDTHTRVSRSYISYFFLYVYLGFVFCVFFHVSLGHIIPVLLAFVVLGLVFFSVPSQEIGWEERLRSDLFSVDWEVKP